MKIMLVISALRNGGAERVVELLSREFSKNHQVETLYFEENLNLYKISGKITHLNIYENRNFLNKFSKFFKIRAYIKRANPDIIISFMDQTNINLIISTIFLKSKIIATEHLSHDALKSQIWRKIRDFSYRFCDALVVLSNIDKEYYSFVKNCKIIYNPLYIKSQNIIKKEKLILSVGRLEPIKGYNLYLDALALIDKNLLNVYKIIIAGDGSERKKLELMARNLGLGIKFVGHVSELDELYKRAEILVLPSLSEAFGNVLNEAGAYGVVRISTPTAGALEILRDEVDALIAKDFSPQALSRVIIKAIKDENLRVNLVKNINLDRFLAENIALKWEELIKELKGQ